MRGTVNTFFRGSIPLGAFMFLSRTGIVYHHISPPFVYFLPLLPSPCLGSLGIRDALALGCLPRHTAYGTLAKASLPRQPRHKGCFSKGYA